MISFQMYMVCSKLCKLSWPCTQTLSGEISFSSFHGSCGLHGLIVIQFSSHFIQQRLSKLQSQELCIVYWLETIELGAESFAPVQTFVTQGHHTGKYGHCPPMQVRQYCTRKPIALLRFLRSEPLPLSPRLMPTNQGSWNQ